MSVEQKILVVDDSAVARLHVKKVLSKLSGTYRVLEAEGGNEALEVAADSQPDLAIVDFNIPDLDGLALVTELRSKWPQIPIVMVTGNSTDSLAEAAGSMNVELIRKPVSPDQKKGFYDSLSEFVENHS